MSGKTPLFFLLFLLFLNLTGCGSGKNRESVHGIPDTLNVAVELSAMTLTPSGDTISGYSFEVMERLMQLHGIPFRFTPVNNIEAFLDTEKSDDFQLFLSNSAITTPMKERFLVTNPLYTDTQVLVQNTENDSILNTVSEIDGFAVWIPKKSAVSERLNNLMEETGDEIEIIEMDGYSEEQLAILVALNEIPRAVVSRSIAAPLSRIYPQLKVDIDLSFPQFRSWLLNPSDSVLCDSLNSWIESFRESEEFKELSRKYDIKL